MALDVTTTNRAQNLYVRQGYQVGVGMIFYKHFEVSRKYIVPLIFATNVLIYIPACDCH